MLLVDSKITHITSIGSDLHNAYGSTFMEMSMWYMCDFWCFWVSYIAADSFVNSILVDLSIAWAIAREIDLLYFDWEFVCEKKKKIIWTYWRRGLHRNQCYNEPGRAQLESDFYFIYYKINTNNQSFFFSCFSKRERSACSATELKKKTQKTQKNGKKIHVKCINETEKNKLKTFFLCIYLLFCP